MAEDTESNLKKLEEEKRALEEKNKGLAKVIEMTSKQHEQQKAAAAKAKPPADAAMGNDTQKALDDLRTSMKTIKKSLNESIKGPAEKHEQMKKMVSDIETKIKDVDKIASLETKLADIEKKVAEQVQKAPSSLGNLFGGFGAKAGGTGAPKNAPRNIGELMKHIDGLKGDMDTRMLNMERRVDSLRHKLGKKNLERLEELISSKQNISDNIVPRRVREEVEKILSTFSFEVEDMADSAKTLADNVEKSNEGFEESVKTINSIQKRMDSAERMISEMRSGYQQTSQTVGNLAGKVESLDVSSKEVEDVIKEAEKLTDKVGDIEKSLNNIENDNRIKTTIKSELSKIASPPKPAPRPPARKSPSRTHRKKRPGHASKASKKSGKARKPAKKPRASKSGAPASDSHKFARKSRTERINSTLKRVEMAYENGLINKERYDRITDKLKRLKKLG
jgi:methyl-accepting chemotaxis protein